MHKQRIGASDPSSIDAAVAELAATFGNHLVTSQAVREQHANTTTWIAPQPPDAVVYPQSAAEVQSAVRICANHDVPVIPFGTGTSFEGSVNAPRGGVCLDLKDMNHVVEVHDRDFDCTVEPGVTRKQLNDYLRSEGMFFPVDPGADASLGGMASTRASGTTTVRYGTMKDNVLALKVVLPNGELISTSRRARKSAAGYDLTRLFVGAEGTLGVITELTLKLHGIPQAIAAGVCQFRSINAACETAILAIQSGIPMARIELLDEVMIRGCNAYSKLQLVDTPTLFVEFHGSDASVVEQSEQFGEIAAEMGSLAFEWATKPEERSRLWRARHDSFWAIQVLRPGARILVTDVCVPISRLAECVTETKADLEKSKLVAPIVGHAGDGNFHAGVLVMMDDLEEVARAKAFADRLAERAISMDGTCTGEHAIGQGKKRFLEAEHGSSAVAAMRAIKSALDPNRIMNPEKIF